MNLTENMKILHFVKVIIQILLFVCKIRFMRDNDLRVIPECLLPVVGELKIFSSGSCSSGYRFHRTLLWKGLVGS